MSGGNFAGMVKSARRYTADLGTEDVVAAALLTAEERAHPRLSRVRRIIPSTLQPDRRRTGRSAWTVSEQLSDFWIGGRDGELPKGGFTLVGAFAQRRKAGEESAYPLAVTGLYRISQIVQLDGQMPTQLSLESP
jgi:hypothetical protein